tara:strand:+ start:55575 stop:55853 length:279 start_codon:yes stop_codon:yes gene_type:complete
MNDAKELVTDFIEDNIDSDKDSRADKLHEMMRHLTLEQRIQVIERSIIVHRDKVTPMQRRKMANYARKMRIEMKAIARMERKSAKEIARGIG